MRKKKFTPKFKKSVTKMKQLSLKSFSASDRRMLMKKMREIEFFKQRSCGLQALKLYHAILDDDTIDNNKKTYTYIATLFQMKEQNIRSLIMRAKKNDGNVQSKVGRPPLLNKKQEEQLVVIIKERNKQKNCMDRSDVLNEISDLFQVVTTPSWVDNFTKRHEEEIGFVESKPLEKERLEVSEQSIKEYFAKLEKMVNDCDANLIVNMDESGDGSKNNKKSKKVLIDQNDNSVVHCHMEDREDAHITFVCAIVSDLSYMRPMVIVTRKSIDSDLLSMGFPDSKLGLVVGSEKGYITRELMMTWINQIFLPEVNKRRLAMKKPKAKCLLILDGHSSHVNEKLTEIFKRNNIYHILLPPHSSHLTQPLDRLIFGNWKNIKKTIRIRKGKYTKQTTRIVKGLKAFSMASNPTDVMKAFKRGGIEISIRTTNPLISINEELVLKHLPFRSILDQNIKIKKEHEIKKEKESVKAKRSNRIKIQFSVKKKKPKKTIDKNSLLPLFPTIKKDI